MLIFDEISRLMGKRLYRLRLVYWRLKCGHDGTGWPAEAAERFEEYPQVLYEWNDSISRNLALVQRYFGPAMRTSLISVSARLSRHLAPVPLGTARRSPVSQAAAIRCRQPALVG